MFALETQNLFKDLRHKVSKLLDNNYFTGFIIALILINAVTLGLETDKRVVSSFGGLLFWLDRIILIIFTIEIVLKFYAYRLNFFRSGWNIFDLAIVAVAWVPASGPIAVLRAFRILRILRLISVVPQMRRVITAIGHSIPGMASVIGVLCLIFYVSAVLATKLFGAHPDPNMQEWFGTISASAYTLFQIMTLESWSMGVVRPTMELYPLSWLFFLPFIIITSFAVLNFFIGIIVDSMQTAHKLEAEEKGMEGDAPATSKEFQILLQRMDDLHREVKILREQK